jgi:hypothetical protein
MVIAKVILHILILGKEITTSFTVLPRVLSAQKTAILSSRQKKTKGTTLQL